MLVHKSCMQSLGKVDMVWKASFQGHLAVLVDDDWVQRKVWTSVRGKILRPKVQGKGTWLKTSEISTLSVKVSTFFKQHLFLGINASL